MSGRAKSIREGNRPAVTRTGKRNGEIRTEDCSGTIKMLRILILDFGHA